ncbi:hypothetical protein F5B22DRAFT_114050 [Xylaria bambusicola]|uniref:uncharacterized protein n=1 Tax=Xylaria bambusicola TaxID=326684 RepID=UPI0020082C66|nr:uncharacterized protein F5B22DRAFT_114050 [Xylaria bambusicola]KAI0517672.1 hypothetical protein F5B22DRAFT_114050 [Xylaria bambusicola]
MSSTMSNATCDFDFPNWASLTSVPTNITVGGIIKTNETMTAMQNCCAPNPIHATGNDSCVLWCEVPKNITTFEEWKDCVFKYSDPVPGLSVNYREAQSMGAAIRPTVKLVAVTGLLALGLYAW